MGIQVGKGKQTTAQCRSIPSAVNLPLHAIDNTPLTIDWLSNQRAVQVYKYKITSTEWNGTSGRFQQSIFYCARLSHQSPTTSVHPRPKSAPTTQTARQQQLQQVDLTDRLTVRAATSAPPAP